VLQKQVVTDGFKKATARVKSREKRVNAALIGSHVAVVAGIVGILAFGYHAPVEASPNLNSQNILEQDSLSVDQIAAATVAADVAHTLDMSVENNVSDLAGTLSIQAELAQTDNNFLNKPQIIEQNSNRAAITTYVTKAGDTVQSVAAFFGLSDDTIRWANNLTGDAIAAGKTLTIPGVTGVVYTVKAGDTVATLADRFKADADRIVTYNDLELSGVVAGQKIIIPGGVLPNEARPTFRAIHMTVYGGNTYAYGYCTYYAFNRRAELGRPIGSNWGNAVSWASYARAAGYRVDRVPEAGAVFQIGGNSWSRLGHVGVVEKVNADGSITVSEMNYAGWNRISSRIITNVADYSYIH
jgi:LysM repeat protein